MRLATHEEIAHLRIPQGRCTYVPSRSTFGFTLSSSTAYGWSCRRCALPMPRCKWLLPLLPFQKQKSLDDKQTQLTVACVCTINYRCCFSTRTHIPTPVKLQCGILRHPAQHPPPATPKHQLYRSCRHKRTLQMLPKTAGVLNTATSHSPPCRHMATRPTQQTASPMAAAYVGTSSAISYQRRPAPI